jgi:hypothetical protein
VMKSVSMIPVVKNNALKNTDVAYINTAKNVLF